MVDDDAEAVPPQDGAEEVEDQEVEDNFAWNERIETEETRRYRAEWERESAWMKSTDDIFVASKAGLLERVKTLVAKDPTSVNHRYFDATPLYYACMAGHFEVCQYLLQQGASCAEDTFDGDRCLYGALNDKIRALLREYSQRKTLVLTPLGEDIAKLQTDKKYVDIKVVVGEEEFLCHRFILASRVPLFARHLCHWGPWYAKERVQLAESDSAPAFSALLRFVYTDVLECAALHVDALIDLCDKVGLSKLSRQAKLESFLLRKVPTLPPADDNSRRREKRPEDKIVQKLYPVGMTLAKNLGRGFIVQTHLAEHTLQCADETFRVHECVVFTRCSYLANLLKEDTRNAFSDTSVTKAYPPNILHCALMFLYTGGKGCSEVLFGSQNGQDISKERNDLIGVLDIGNAYLLPGLSDWAAHMLVARHLIDRSNVWEWLDLTFIYPSAALREVCFSVIGEAMVNDELQGKSIKPVVEALAMFLQASCESDAEKKDYFIAEIREAFVEALPADVPIERRDAITDDFEEVLGFTDAHQLQKINQH